MRTFIEYLIDEGILEKEQRGVWYTFTDLEIRDFLVSNKILRKKQADILWSNYIKGDRYVKR